MKNKRLVIGASALTVILGGVLFGRLNHVPETDELWCDGSLACSKNRYLCSHCCFKRRR